MNSITTLNDGSFRISLFIDLEGGKIWGHAGGKTCCFLLMSLEPLN